MVAKFMLSDNGTLSINSQIYIKVTHTIRRKKKMQSTWLEQKVATLECEPEENKENKGREKTWNLAALEIQWVLG